MSIVRQFAQLAERLRPRPPMWHAGAIATSPQRAGAPAAARHSDMQYRMLLEHSGEAILVFDQEARFLEVNARACEMVGWSHDEFLRRRVSDLAVPEQSKPLQWTELRAGKIVES